MSIWLKVMLITLIIVGVSFLFAYVLDCMKWDDIDDKILAKKMAGGSVGYTGLGTPQMLMLHAAVF